MNAAVTARNKRSVVPARARLKSAPKKITTPCARAEEQRKMHLAHHKSIGADLNVGKRVVARQHHQHVGAAQIVALRVHLARQLAASGAHQLQLAELHRSRHRRVIIIIGSSRCGVPTRHERVEIGDGEREDVAIALEVVAYLYREETV